MQIRRVNMTSKHAQKILNNNVHNRNIRKRKVEAYARDMLAGNWHDNGETVKIATDGTLLDGQHRLLAVVKADVTVPMVVVYDLAPEVQNTVDTGAKRTFGDQLSLDHTKNANVVAAVTRRLVMWDQGQHYVGGEMQPTETEMRSYLDKHGDIIMEAAHKAVSVRTDLKKVPTSVAGLLYVKFRNINKAQAEEFFEALSTGEGLVKGSPILALRRKFINMQAEGGPTNANEIQAYITHTWNLWRKGAEAPRYIHAPKGGWNTSNMPVPK